MATEERSFEDLVQAIKREVEEIINPDDIEPWLAEPHQELSGRSPNDVLREDGEAGYEVVLALVRASKEGLCP